MAENTAYITKTVRGCGEIKRRRTDRLRVPRIDALTTYAAVFGQFTNPMPIAHMIVELSAANEDARALCRASIASLIAAIFPDIGEIFLDNGIFSDVVREYPIPAEIAAKPVEAFHSHWIRYQVLGTLCSVVKNIDASNLKYLESRYTAFCASIRAVPDSRVFYLNVSEFLNTVRGKQDLINSICFFMEEPPEDLDSQAAALLTQIKMVWKGYGMNITHEMYRFATESNSMALLRFEIARQASDFIKLYTKLKEDLGRYFDYSKVMKNPEIEPLNHRTFNNLYVAAVQEGQLTGRLMSRLQTTSSIKSSVPLDKLKEDIEKCMPEGARVVSSSSNIKTVFDDLNIDFNKAFPGRGQEKESRLEVADRMLGRIMTVFGLTESVKDKD